MDKLHKFHSIDNYKSSNHISSYECYYKDWVVMEKVHGCNFSFTTDGKDVLMGRRNSFLSNELEENAFYKVNIHMNKYKQIIRDIHKYIGGDNVVTIYGELFGGNSIIMKTIQSSIFYCPTYEFYAFDIRVVDKYLDYDRCIEIFERFGLFYAKPLFRGKFDVCIAWSNEHKHDVTTIPVQLGLSDSNLTMSNNIREGHVIKPVVPAYYNDGKNIAFKDKSDKFLEKQDVVKVNTEVAAEHLSYVTHQRLDNVISKIGDIDVIKQNKKNIKVIFGLYVTDVLQDMIADGVYIDDIATKNLNSYIMTNMILPLFK